MIKRIIVLVIILCLFAGSCRQVNQERAKEYYDKHVQHFPEEHE